MKSSLKTLCAAALVGAVLAGCGGGQQGQRFGAARMLAFGDESSFIGEATGRKYTVNARRADTGEIDCSANPLWIQTLALSFGLHFRECSGPVADALSRILAVPFAKATDLAAQIDAFLAEPQTFNGGDLVSLLAGQNDILALYDSYDGSNGPALVAAAEALGSVVSAQAIRIADAGAKVLVATVPDLGLTPFARAQGAERAALLTAMTRRFNIGLLLSLPNDGHRFGLVRSDDLVRNLVSQGPSSGLANVTDAACVAPLPDCDTDRLSSDANGTPASASTWLWADDRHVGPTGHASLAAVAVQRAHNNPF